MPPESAAAGYEVNEPAVHAFIATSQVLGLAPKVMEQLLQYDAVATWEELDPDPRVNPAELEAAERILEVLPPVLRQHVLDRGHLHVPEFVSFLARAGAPLRKLSAAGRADLRNRIAKALHERRR